MSSWIKLPAFVLVLIGLFVWAGDVVSRAAGFGGPVGLGSGVGVERGREVFWGAGKCYTCHRVGPRGSAVRGPALGRDGGVAFETRAAERSRALSTAMSATDYIVESLAQPSAYLAPGFKNEMPRVYEPPISLDAEQIASVVLYLQSIDGAPDPAAIHLPAELRSARSGVTASRSWQPYMEGDAARGRRLFFDPRGPAPCARCHIVDSAGGRVGPDLTAIAGTRGPEYILESILRPSATIAGGYETVLIETTRGRILDGIIRDQTADSVFLVTAEGDSIALATGAIARQRIQETSLMPGDLAEVLTVADLHDLLAYLLTLR